MNNEEKIKVVVINKNTIQELLIKNMDDIYGIIYYPYQETLLFDNIYILYSKEATQTKNKIFYKNVKVNGIEIYGAIIAIAKDKKGLVSLTDEQVKEIKNIFGRKN